MASKKPSGLGRGLGALLGEEALHQESSPSMILPITQVERYVDQPRKYFDPEALTELAESIALHGIIQPITVRKLASGYYQIIAGERRWRAARQAGLIEVPVIVMEADDRKMAELAMIENLQREDLNPMEESLGYQALMASHRMTQQEVAKQVGKSRSAVTNALRLLTLSPALHCLVEDGTISAGHARALLSLAPDVQESTAQEIVKGQLSVRQTEALVKKIQSGEDLEPPTTIPTTTFPMVDYVADAQQNLQTKLGRGVKIVSGRKKGRIELEFYGTEDLNDLLDALALIRGQQKPI